MQGLWLQQTPGQDDAQEVLRRWPQELFWALPGKGFVTAEMASQVRTPRAVSRVVKTMDERERLQTALLEIEQVMQAERAVNNDPAIARLLEMKQREADQTRAALRATRPLRRQSAREARFRNICDPEG